MQRKQSDEIGRGICCRLIRYVVVKLTAGQKEDKTVKKKLIKKESESGIEIYFKEREDSDGNAANPINTTASRSEKERVIMLVNGSSDVGSKKMIHENGKSMASEGSFKRPVVVKLDEDGEKSRPEPFSNDINKRSHAFIQSRLEQMRKHL